ncbi:alpha/beta hydrolase [Dactylosporangium sp. NPDC049140]|uniref:alpha/beta fold hydrolase n=1 Tax=Dactylosporangium sp. NPDC049140 TaxID=3155647 RepID=UPI00340C4E88
MVDVQHHRAETNGVRLHYVTAGHGPVVLGLHGWPESHRQYLRLIERFADRYRFIAPDLRGCGDSDKPFGGYEPNTIAADLLGLLEAEGVEQFHIVGHDLGGPPAVALAYAAGERALSLSTIETPFFGLDYPGYVDPMVNYWHLGMHAHMDITRMLLEGREEQYLRHFFRDFAYNPDAVAEDEVQAYAALMRQPGTLRGSLNLYGCIPQMTEQTRELAARKLPVPMMAWGGEASFGSHCIDSARAIAEEAHGGVIERCGHWVFQERPGFICDKLDRFWAGKEV